uniref:G_PROTEIN_RECEP_F1_2 domain-containing protein n=1 Tax=Ascaris lumbricoides TaxID=6252 RepID=A0A0M3IA89_ASCLU
MNGSMTVENLSTTNNSYLGKTPSSPADSGHRRDQIIAGVSYCIISFIFLFLYTAVLLVLKKKSVIFSSTAYRIIFHLGVADCLQLLFHFVGGVFTIAASTFNFWLSKICGGLLNSAWITLIPLTLLLAVNRFFAIFCDQNNDVARIMDRHIERWKQMGATGTSTSQGMRNEIRVLIQAIAITGYTTLCLWVWHDYDIFFDDSKWVVFTVNSIWIINGGMNPCLYLTLNKTMRRELFSLVSFSTSTSAVTMITTSKKGETLMRIKRANTVKRFTVKAIIALI